MLPMSITSSCISSSLIISLSLSPPSCKAQAAMTAARMSASAAAVIQPQWSFLRGASPAAASDAGRGAVHQLIERHAVQPSKLDEIFGARRGRAVSQRETAWRETPSTSATSFWDRPLCLLASVRLFHFPTICAPIIENLFIDVNRALVAQVQLLVASLFFPIYHASRPFCNTIPIYKQWSYGYNNRANFLESG